MLQHELMAPGFCIICEGAFEGIEYFDTGYDLDLDTITYVSGRKYVCETCFNRMAESWGYEASNQIEQALYEKERVKAEITEIYNMLDDQRNTVMNKWHEVESRPMKARGRPRKQPLDQEGSVIVASMKGTIDHGETE